MQIKTIVRTGSGSNASLRRVTLGHAIRILVSEILQAGGTFTYCWPRSDRRPLCETMREYVLEDAAGFVFTDGDTEYEFKGDEFECAFIANIATHPICRGARPGQLNMRVQRHLMARPFSEVYDVQLWGKMNDPKRKLHEIAELIDSATAWYFTNSAA